MKNFNIKKFLTAIAVLIPVLLLVDIGYDKLFKTLDFKETFAMKNLFFKIAAAIVGAYFFATFSNENKKEQ